MRMLETCTHSASRCICIHIGYLLVLVPFTITKCVCVCVWELGMSGLQVRGGGFNRAPKIWGGVGKRAQLTGTINHP